MANSSRIRSIRRPVGSYAPCPASAPGTAESLALWLPALGIDPVSAVEWSCPEGWGIPARRIQDDMAFCILSGAFAGRIGRDTPDEPLGPGGVLLIPRGEEHWIRRCGGECRMVSLHFHARLYGTIDALAFLGAGGVYCLPERGRLRSLPAELAREFALRPPGWTRMLHAGLEEILLELLRQGRSAGPEGGLPRKDPRQIARLAPVLEELRARLDDPMLRVGDLARVAHLSEVALRRRFRSVLGASPAAILRRERIARARRLLRTTDETIARIAERCGFRDVPFFYRVFGRLTGTTAARYREALDE